MTQWLRTKFLALKLWYISVRCNPHRWRPALTSKGPARSCQYCLTTEQLTEQEFYAQFGRMPYL